MPLVAGVELVEQGEIPEVHEAGDDVIQAGSGRVQQGFDVAEHLGGLAGDVVADQLAGPGIESALARQEDPVAHDQPGRIRARRRRSPGGADDFLHGCAPSGAARGGPPQGDNNIAKFLCLWGGFGLGRLGPGVASGLGRLGI
jgi:hypothetical protein